MSSQATACFTAKNAETREETRRVIDVTFFHHIAVTPLLQFSAVFAFFAVKDLQLDAPTPT